MVDFLKVEDLPEKDYAYVCDRCGEEIVFVARLVSAAKANWGAAAMNSSKSNQQCAGANRGKFSITPRFSGASPFSRS